LSWWVKCLVQ